MKCIPTFNPSLQDQKCQTDISDESFELEMTPIPSTRFERFVQFCMFFLFFGWLRVILLVVVIIVYAILMCPLMLFHSNKRFVKIFGVIGYGLSRLAIRCVVFCFGVFWIDRKGDEDYTTRLMMFNHQCIFDGPLLYITRPFVVIGMLALRKVPLFGAILIAAESVFIDRSKSEGQAQIMTKAIQDHSTKPVAMAPEGKTTKGTFMLDFRTGGFLHSERIQPVTIRYKSFGAVAGTGLVWTVGGFKEFLWRAMCCPGTIVEMHYLPVLGGDEWNALSAKEKALKCQLLMANDLGVLASSRNSRDLFKKPKAE